ncbi:MAG: hypothetical protein NTW87_32310 [Planctomycetota bacterium]|nr:hypothetical protein [Planctomycetota bacterium]
MRSAWVVLLLLCGLGCQAGEKSAPATPPAGQVFYFSPANPRYVTCDIEFRDPDGKLWPCFFYGFPAEGGTHQFDPASPKAAFSIVYDKMCQPHGDQSRKIIGELVKPDKPPVMTFTVNGMTPFKKDRLENTGKDRNRGGEATELDAVLDIDGKKLPLKAPATVRYDFEKDGGNVTQAYIEARFTIQGSDLGLKAEGAKGPIAVRASMCGTVSKTPPPKKKK